MTSVTVRLTDAQAEQLALEARKLGVTAEDLLRAAVLDLIEGRNEAFLAAARHVIEKNAELYQRLS
ncbi:MAG: ribbon-helix-helix protein, CopG family [Holophagales bacterium]|nr:ribbon-helix-helix protein, CopG family [Holophagales bacterium]